MVWLSLASGAEELAEAQTAVRQQEARLHEARETYSALTEGFTATRARLSDLRAQLNAWHRQSAGLHNRRESISRELAVLEERRRSLLESRASAAAEQERLADEQRAAEERLAEARADLERIQAEGRRSPRAGSRCQSRALGAADGARRGGAETQRRPHASSNDLNGRRARHQARLHELKNRIDLAAPETARGRCGDCHRRTNLCGGWQQASGRPEPVSRPKPLCRRPKAR